MYQYIQVYCQFFLYTYLIENINFLNLFVLGRVSLKFCEQRQEYVTAIIKQQLSTWFAFEAQTFVSLLKIHIFQN